MRMRMRMRMRRSVARRSSVEVPGKGGALDRAAVGPGEDVAARLPAVPRRLMFLGVLVAVLFEGAQARCRQGDAPFRALGLGGQGGQPAAVGALEGASACADSCSADGCSVRGAAGAAGGGAVAGGIAGGVLGAAGGLRGRSRAGNEEESSSCSVAHSFVAGPRC
jgi:hypothetical protein